MKPNFPMSLIWPIVHNLRYLYNKIGNKDKERREYQIA